nr:SHOCT domain-containing protein [Halococcus hamelinensis]
MLFFSVFIISPALAVYAYLRVTDADEDDVWHSLIDSGKSNDNGGPVSDDQLEITMVDTGRDDDPDPDSLDTLRERYATGELTDEQFEHKVDQLLQTNSPEHAAEWRDRRRETLKE